MKSRAQHGRVPSRTGMTAEEGTWKCQKSGERGGGEVGRGGGGSAAFAAAALAGGSGGATAGPQGPPSTVESERVEAAPRTETTEELLVAQARVETSLAAAAGAPRLGDARQWWMQRQQRRRRQPDGSAQPQKKARKDGYGNDDVQSRGDESEPLDGMHDMPIISQAADDWEPEDPFGHVAAGLAEAPLALAAARERGGQRGQGGSARSAAQNERPAERPGREKRKRPVDETHQRRGEDEGAGPGGQRRRLVDGGPAEERRPSLAEAPPLERGCGPGEEADDEFPELPTEEARRVMAEWGKPSLAEAPPLERGCGPGEETDDMLPELPTAEARRVMAERGRTTYSKRRGALLQSHGKVRRQGDFGRALQANAPGRGGGQEKRKQDGHHEGSRDADPPGKSRRKVFQGEVAGRRYTGVVSDPVDSVEAQGHALLITGPFIWCSKCGRYARSRLRPSLKGRCIGVAEGAYSTRLSRLRRGEHPLSGKAIVG